MDQYEEDEGVDSKEIEDANRDISIGNSGSGDAVSPANRKIEIEKRLDRRMKAIETAKVLLRAAANSYFCIMFSSCIMFLMRIKVISYPHNEHNTILFARILFFSFCFFTFPFLLLPPSRF